MERPLIKDKNILAYVEYIENKLEDFLRSPYCESYITIKCQIDSFNEQLTIKKPEIKKIIIEGKEHELESTHGKIDLFADKDDKSFDKAWKYLNELVDLIESLDKFRKLLTPEETKKADKILKEKNLGTAEKIALKNHGG